MATTLILLALAHVTALAAVLLLARYSTMLVDEDGRPVAPSTWHERVVPTGEAVRATPPSRIER